MTTEYRFEVEGRFLPYVRMTQRGKWVKARAREYLASQDALSWELRRQMVENGWERIPKGVPLEVEVWIEQTERLHTKDFDNELKAVVDAAEGVVYENDRWIDRCFIDRRIGPKDRIVFVVRTLDSDRRLDRNAGQNRAV